MTRLTLTFAVASIAAAIAQPAAATLLSATLDWSQLQVQVSGVGSAPTPTLTFSDKTSAVGANGDSPGEGSEHLQHTLTGWTVPKSVTADTANAGGSATVTDATLSATAFSQASSGTASDCWFCYYSNDGYAGVDRAARFSLSGAGTVTFSIPYTYSLSATDGYSYAQFGGSADFTSSLSPLTGNSHAEQSAFLNASASPQSGSGTLIFGFVATGAGSGGVDFNISLNSSSPFSGGFVPEPSTYAGLAPGLVAVGFIARRRKSLANIA
ncbi:MAG: PEP-CTERM sorting domain-containing protein [Betaproteobacteria bacterium]